MMRKCIRPIAVMIIILIYPLIFKSCANTTTPPSGGDKDSIPPVLLSIEPLSKVNHPMGVKQSPISFTFDEYIVLKDPSKNIFLSPPLNKVPKALIKGKRLIVSFEERLDSNTTYSLDLGQSVTDNNEGIPFPKYVYSFSTGEIIDSLFVSGTIVNAKTMLAMDKMTILFHSDPSDSAIFNILPKCAAKSDIWGYFTVRNIAPGSYRVFAIEDKNNNNKYDPGEEMVAFLDSLVIPKKVMKPQLAELKTVDLKDTLTCMERPSDIRLYMFKEPSSRHFIKNKGRPSKRMMFLTFSTPFMQIDSLSILGYEEDKIIKEFNSTKDSLVLWVNDQGIVPDTLTLSIKYMKTDDSLKVLMPTKELIKLSVPKPKKTKNRYGDVVDVKDTIAKYKLIAEGETIEQDGFVLEFESPLLKAPFDSISMKYITMKQQVKDEEFTVVQDSTNIRRYTVRAKSPLVLGYDYIIKIPHRKFVDINGLPCDSLEKKVTLPNDDKLSSITAELKNIKGNYIVELINERGDKVFRSYRVNKDCKVLFPYLKEGKYSIRITEDKNGNGMVDTGSVLERRQPEKVLLYKAGISLGNDAYLITLTERLELEQTIDIKEMFK